MLTITDWRDAAAHEIQPLLEREVRRWREELHWDVGTSWRRIEPARQARALPGFVARDAGGAIVGWVWFLQHRGCLQVAALVIDRGVALEADRADVTRALVDAVRSSPESVSATCTVWSIRGVPPALEDVLHGHGLRTTRYLYLRADLSRVRHDATDLAAAPGRGWQPGDLPAAVLLFRDAYGQASTDHSAVRAFAPRGTVEEWRDYLRTLVETDGCGLMIPQASRIVTRGGVVIAGIVTSLIDAEEGVAHISQIAVAPGARGEGLGRALVGSAMAVCRALGCSTITLLVGRENVVARQVYENAGFTATTEFVVASSPEPLDERQAQSQAQPRRLTSVALAMGGVSTRR